MQVVDYGKIKQIMDDKRLRLDDFSKVMEISKGSISRKLRGKQFLTVPELLQVAQVLETDVRELFIDEEAIKQYMLIRGDMRLVFLGDLPQFTPSTDPLSPFVKETFTKDEVEKYKKNHPEINWDALELAEYLGTAMNNPQDLFDWVLYNQEELKERLNEIYPFLKD